MAGYGKKSLWQKFTEAAGKATRKVIGLTVLFGAAAAPVYYEYGTTKELDVKVTSYVDNTHYNYDTRKKEGGYLIKTDKGDFVIEKSWPHLQGDDDVMNVWRPIYPNKTYHIETYGFHLAGTWQPNILSVKELTAEDLKAREQERLASLEKDKKPAPDATVNGNAAVPGVTQQQQAGAPQQVIVQQQQTLSGEVVSYPVVVNGYSVQLTIPVEMVGKVSVNSVRPVAPAPVIRPQ